MPRTKRNTGIGEYHLVIAKANWGSKLFYQATDYEEYLAHLRQFVRDRLVKLYAFCLCENEIRLIVMPNRSSLARTMQRLHGGHALRMNHKHLREGHLFAQRFQSWVFHSADLCDVVRSAHLWPVRDGIVRRAESYKYSSHNAYTSHQHPWSDLIEHREVLTQFSSDITIAKKSFTRFVESAALDIDDYGLSTPIILVNNTPQSTKRRLSLGHLSKRASLLLNVNHAMLLSTSRRQELVMARRLFATAAVRHAERTITEVAQFLGRDKAQVSRLVSQGMDLLENDEPFKTLFESLKGKRKIE